MSVRCNQKHRTWLLQGVLIVILIVASTVSLRYAHGGVTASLQTVSLSDASELIAPVEDSATEIALPQTLAALQALVQLKLTNTVAIIAIASAILAGTRTPVPPLRLSIPPLGRHQRIRL